MLDVKATAKTLVTLTLLGAIGSFGYVHATKSTDAFRERAGHYQIQNLKKNDFRFFLPSFNEPIANYKEMKNIMKNLSQIFNLDNPAVDMAFQNVRITILPSSARAKERVDGETTLTKKIRIVTPDTHTVAHEGLHNLYFYALDENARNKFAESVKNIRSIILPKFGDWFEKLMKETKKNNEQNKYDSLQKKFKDAFKLNENELDALLQFLNVWLPIESEYRKWGSDDMFINKVMSECYAKFGSDPDMKIPPQFEDAYRGILRDDVLDAKKSGFPNENELKDLEKISDKINAALKTP